MNSFTLSIFVICYTYAATRYHLGANIPLSEWVFILNKAIAWTAFLWIGLSILPQKVLDRLKSNRRTLGIYGFSLGIIHIVTTLFQLDPQHYAKLYTDSSLNFMGWIAIALGIVSSIIYVFPMIGALRNRPSTDSLFRLGKFGFFFSTLHPAVIGFSGWLVPNSWPLYLPPITLLAFLLGICFLVIRSFSKRS